MVCWTFCDFGGTAALYASELSSKAKVVYGRLQIACPAICGIRDMLAFTAPVVLPRCGSARKFTRQHAPSRLRPMGRGRRGSTMMSVDLTPEKSVSLGALSRVYPRLPRPVVIARQQLNQDFAVLLMRSGYTAVDELDFVPMQQFQAVFFDIRSREWEKFIRSNFGIRQGLIADPRYFDFISYAQMLTVQHFIRQPQVVFEEAYGDTDGSFKTRIVRRDVERLPTPESLLIAWRKKVGSAIYDKMVDSVKRPVATEGADLSQVSQGIKEIYDYFLVGGFCLNVQLTAGDGKRIWRVEMVAPCTLWGCEALQRIRSIPNNYDCLCVEAFCERCGTEVKCSTRFTESSIVREWWLA